MHHRLPLTIPWGFPYQITKYLAYEEWIILLELKDQLIISNILALFLNILDFETYQLSSSVGIDKKSSVSKTCF